MPQSHDTRLPGLPVDDSSDAWVFKAIFDAAPDALLYIQDGRIRATNAAAADVFGYAGIEELKSADPVSLWPCHLLDGRSMLEWAQVQLDETPDCAHLAWICRRKDGTPFSARMRLQPLAGGEAGRFYVAARRSEERNDLATLQAQQDNLQLTQFFESVIDNADVWLNVLDKQANVLIWNKAAELISGYCRSEVQNNPYIWEWLYPDAGYRAWVGARAAEILAQGPAAQDFETTILTKAGEKRIISWDSRVLHDNAGNVTGSIAIARDVTEAKRTQASLIEAKQAAEHAARAKGDFLSNMSHELRTPMNAIIGYSGLALKQELPPKLRDYMAKIDGAGRSLLTIINDILDFSKIEAGKLTMEDVPFAVGKVLDEVADLLAHKAAEKDLEFILAMDEKLSEEIVGDPLRLKQILINLAGNALKFTERGHVLVRAELLEASADHLLLRFVVQDTGIGMTQDQQEGLFQAFVQADSSMTRKFGGTGLGLTISRRLVHQMGGRIWVDSELGKGCAFSFTARFARPGSPPQNLPAWPPVAESAHVLIVDDHDLCRQVLIEQLTACRCQVTGAASAAEAWQVLLQPDHPCDLVLMDWQMPGIDGLEAIRHMRAHPHLAAIPTVIMGSAYAREDIRNLAQLAGARGFLVKPVRPAQLPDFLRQALAYDPPDFVDTSSGHAGPTAGPAPLAKARVLLVEDNAVNRELALELLLGAGLEVDLAKDGREAVSMVDRCQYDAVLMDVQMPEMDGREATARIRANPARRKMPIIAMTAHALPGYREECLAAGMDDYIAKPVDPRALLGVLSRWIKIDGAHAAATTAGDDQGLGEFATLQMVLDVRGALDMVGGQRELLRRLLRQCLLDKDLARVEGTGSLAHGQPMALAAVAHAVKSIAATVAARTLFHHAQALEEALHHDRPWQALYGPFAQAAEELKHALRAWLGNTSSGWQPDVVPQATMTAAQRGELWDTLAIQLRRQSIAARKTAQVLALSVVPELRLALLPLEEALARMDFQHARRYFKDIPLDPASAGGATSGAALGTTTPAVEMSTRQTMLIVDDLLFVLEELSQLVGNEYDVLVAVNGEEAIELALKETPDLILLDVVMGQQNGYEVLSVLKAAPCTADIPVIFVTGLGSEADEVRGLRMGAVDYITKPFCPEIIQTRIRMHLELKRSRDLLRQLALMDGLTGIANRGCFNDRLGREWARSVRTQSTVSLILADIDHFKTYNDFYGHPSGDSCLIQVARIFQSESLRPSDLAARFGGEEFALLLPETDLAGAILVAERIQAHLGKMLIPHENSAVSSQVTLSLGVASMAAVPGLSCSRLVQEADRRLYEAKRQGRNRIRHAPTIDPG